MRTARQTLGYQKSAGGISLPALSLYFLWLKTIHYLSSSRFLVTATNAASIMLDRKNTSPFVPLWPVFGSAANGTSSSSIISRLSAPSSFGRFANGTASGSMVTVVVPGPPDGVEPLSLGPEELPPPPPEELPPPPPPLLLLLLPVISKLPFTYSIS